MKLKKSIVFSLCLSLASTSSLWAGPSRPRSGGRAAVAPSASVVTQQNREVTNLTQLVTAASYIAGLGFAVGAIMKFKMHKDNPTQVPIGTPMSLVFIAGALLFMPSILAEESVAKTGPYGLIEPN
jgi:intracellular multiplication protein IcmD